MIALNPIKKDELSHTEPKLWNRRRQIETPTVFNNVEEIPDAIEKFCPFPRPPSVCARSRTAEGARASPKPRWPAGRLPPTQWPTLKCVKDAPPVAQAPNAFCLKGLRVLLCGVKHRGGRTLFPLWTHAAGKQPQRSLVLTICPTLYQIIRCLLHFKVAQSFFHSDIML